MDMKSEHPIMKSKNKSNRRNRNSVKVVYISSPMKVKTSASRFRALVQELTGRDSDISRYNGATTESGIIFDRPEISNSINNDYVLPVQSVDTNRESPTSSDSVFDDVFSSHMVERLEGMFPSSLFYDDSSQLNVLGSYGAL